MSDHDDDDDDSSSSYSFGSIFDSLRFYGRSGSGRAITPAGRMMEQAKRADEAIKKEADITDDVRAVLRRCQIRSMWPTWDHKA